VVLGVLDEGAKLDSVENIGLLLSGETIALSVATTFNVKDVIVGPHVLIITDEGTLGITGQSGLTSAGKTKQDSCVTVGADVGGAVHRECVPLGHVVVHNTKDTFLHFTGVGAAKDDLLLGGEVDVDGVLTLDVFKVSISAELSSVEDSEVGASLKVFLDLLLGCALQHLFHEKGVVGTGRNNSCFKLEAFVPPSILINNKDLQKS
jgi:hypothetical protein